MHDEPAAVVTAAASADDAFGADLYRLLSQDATDTVFSPVSVAAALRMALCGARGQTAAELAGALHLDGSRTDESDSDGSDLDGWPDEAAEGLRALSALVGDVTADGEVTLRAPGTLWVQSGLPLRAEFTARLAGAAAALAGADFAGAPEAARTEINRVIAEQTEGKIIGLLPPGAVHDTTGLVLASAIYLKAAWVDQFSEAETRDGPFYPDGPERPSVTVPMMRRMAARPYLRAGGYQAVLLPYRDGGLAMAVVLPDGPLETLRPLIAGTAGGTARGTAGGAAGLRGLLAGASRHQVTLSMPRFRLETAFDLVPVLRRLGVRQAFSDVADFTGITDAARLRIDAVAHKAYVDVDEEGTEAAAATGVTVRAVAAFLAPPRVTMTVDRPFLFAIIHTRTALPLFVGQVSHPQGR
jgi:serpin B